MMQNNSFSRGSLKLVAGSVLGLLLCGWLVLHLAARKATRDDAIGGVPIVSVARESFTLEVIDRGVVRPARISPISSQISSNLAKIVWLIEEGSEVKKGDMVARFDSKPFEDALLQAEQAYGDAKVTFQASEKLLSIQQEEEKGKIEEAERKLAIAKIQANNSKNGAGPLQRQVLEQKLHQAERELAIDSNELNDLEVLLQKGHVSVRERDKIADRVQSAREAVAVAKAELENFATYLWPKILREADLLVSGAESDLTRVQRTAELLIANRAAEVEKNRRLVDRKLEELDRAKVDVRNCEIFSPTDGILLYAELPRDNGKRRVQIGDSVWVGQTFLQVPDTTDLVAEVDVREVDIAQIEPGMKANIEVDAFPGQRFTGTVDAIASLADDDVGEATLRRFPTRIRFAGDTGKVHVGMSVTVRIVYRELSQVIAIPIASVIYQQNKTLVKKVGEDGAVIETEVSLGARGRQFFEVQSGLAAGDRILREG
jgi:HlyD family secretion protein